MGVSSSCRASEFSPRPPRPRGDASLKIRRYWLAREAILPVRLFCPLGYSDGGAAGGEKENLEQPPQVFARVTCVTDV
jgi:hypothetical protein